MMVMVVVKYHIISIINFKHWFKVTHYVSITHNYLSLFKYSYVFQSVKTIIRPPFQYGCLMTVFTDQNM